MKKYIILLCLSGNLIYAQKTMTTFYDRQKTKKMEVYQVDATGEKNGVYKNYDEEGALRNEVMFKSGKKNGACIEYTKFPNYKGVMQIKSKETYLNDLKEGIAVYYSYDENLGVYESQKGNYKKDEKDGAWTIIVPFDRILPAADFDYIKSLPVFKGSMAVKESVTYQNGEKFLSEGKHEAYYYPSNKVYHTYIIKNGKFTDTEGFLFPDSKIWSAKFWDEKDVYMASESYYYNGKLKYKEMADPYSYEGYNPDGTPDKAMQAEIEKKKK